MLWATESTETITPLLMGPILPATGRNWTMTIVLGQRADSPRPQEVMTRAAQLPLAMPRRGIGLQPALVVDSRIPMAGLLSSPCLRASSSCWIAYGVPAFYDGQDRAAARPRSGSLIGAVSSLNSKGVTYKE